VFNQRHKKTLYDKKNEQFEMANRDDGVFTSFERRENQQIHKKMATHL
jgi:hypothetical protein